MPAVLRLTLTRFRNYRTARLEVGPQPVVLTGPNGAGKTNLLEALSFLSPGRGLRRARLDELGHHGSPDWGIAATLDTAAGTVEIGTGADPTPGKDRRLVRIDGQPARNQTALTEHLSVLWLTPQMDRLFVESGSGRRRFIDRLVFGFDPGHAGRIARYEHALRERARLLREGITEPSWLAALEDRMARDGVAVSLARAEVADRITAACAAGIGPFPRAELALTGTLEEWLADQPALPVEDRLRARFCETRRSDAEAGTTALGPHRSDLMVRYRTETRTAPADSSSTGEQKALLIAIVLANARLLAEQPAGAPLLLLDEVAAHLDSNRRAALFTEIEALGGQAWMTGTDESMFHPLHGRAQFVTVREGQAVHRQY
ncbi:MAG: DNA replication/repair protein RecF [Rhodospirillaceae bacterium]